MNITSLPRILIRQIRLFRCIQASRINQLFIKSVLHINFNNSTVRSLSSVFSKSPDYSTDTELLPLTEFEPICSTTLESLTDYFEEIVEADSKLVNGDVIYSDGVLTIKLGNEYGTYVINRQTPNRQIWLSSPISGPKRYDWINDDWIYKHNGISLHALLQHELEKILSVPVDFLNLRKQ